MNFDLDDDERALRDAIRDLCAGQLPVERLRATGGRVERDLWRHLADAGVFGLCLPESQGGIGLTDTHAVVVFEQLGAALVHGPTAATHLAAGIIDGAADGSRVVGLVRRDGLPVLVPHLPDLDELLVIDGDGVWKVDPAQLHVRAEPRPLDPLTPVSRLDQLPDGIPVGDRDQARQLRRRHDLLTAALLVGLAAAATDRAVQYAKEREQFGRPIGSFQAVKHLCADMLTRAEVARAQVHAAAVHLADPDLGDEGPMVAGAYLLAADAAERNGKACIQVHGGMGFTWEVDAHLYLKRALVLTALGGGVDDAAEQVAATL